MGLLIEPCLLIGTREYATDIDFSSKGVVANFKLLLLYGEEINPKSKT